jgi:hypothetical protein
MKKVYKYLGLIVAFIFISANVFAAEKDRIVKNSFKVNADTELKIKNSFGDVNVESYSGSEIFIEVKIWAKGSSEEKVLKFINSIDIDFHESSDEIRVKTSNISNNGKVNKFEVNYTVKMPIGNELSIDNSFGNVNIASHKGKIDLDISHGNFDLGTVLNDDNEIELQFGNGNIEKFGSGSIELSHSNLDIVRISDLNLDSNFSNTKIEKILGSIKAEVSHGSLKTKSIDKNFRKIEIEAEFSTVRLKLNEKSSYDLEFRGSFTSFSKPSNFEVTNRDKDYTSETIIGNNNGGGAKVKLIMSHSTLSLD